MSKIINIFISPIKVFTAVKEKPDWVLPFIVVLVVVALSALAAVSASRGNEEAMARQEEMMRDRGMSEEQIEQAMNISQGPLPMIFGSIGGAIFVAITLVLFTLILHVFIPLFGGMSGFPRIFSVVCYAALVSLPGAILRVIIMFITKSLFVATSLALFAPAIEKTSFLWQFLNGFDFFVFWEMVLVAIGISVTNEIKRTNAYILVFIIWIISIFISVGLGMLGGRAG